MNKKKLFSLALAVIMIATISFSSLAWFTDEDTAKNNFTIGGAGTNDPDKIFSVDVKENVDGEEEPVEEWGFENLLPGDKFKKEAFITNTGSYDQYIRVVMTITDWKEIEEIVTINMDDDFIDNWYITSGNAWVNEDIIKDHSTTVLDADGNLVITMYLNKKLAPGETVNIMDFVKISEKATQDSFASANFADGFQITFDADAVQTENILTNIDSREWYNAMMTFKTLEG